MGRGKREPGSRAAGRPAVVVGAAVFCFVCLLVRILMLQTAGYGKYRDRVFRQITVETELPAARGRIYDRNGVLLASNVTAYRAFISPRAIAEASARDRLMYDRLIASGLSEILDVPRDFILEQTALTRSMDRTLARDIGEETAGKVRAFVRGNGLGGMVFLQPCSVRRYPRGALACHALGFTGSDGRGQYGLELSYDRILSGTAGRSIVARDSHGREMPRGYRSRIEAQDGDSLVTTLDVHIQACLEEQLRETYTASKGQNRACGAVVDVRTGEVLALATYPPFDPNEPRKLNEDCQRTLEASGLPEGSPEYRALLQDLQLETWSDKPVSEMYMPGSTFKVVTAAMAFEEGLVDPEERFSCPGYFTVSGRRIHCHKREGHGSLTFSEGIQQSCNPVLMQMGLRVGADRFYRYFESFGYPEGTDIDLPGEASCLFYRRDRFTELDLATASFGQNFKVTPIGHLMAMAAVANGGTLLRPRLVREVTDADGRVVERFGPSVRRQVVSAETAATLARVLEEGVSGSGGARNAYVSGYRVAAKTGTSQKTDKRSETGREYYVCSCMGFAPADDPRIAVLIMVDEPTSGVIYGSYVAAPYLANVMRYALPYLGVEPVYTDREIDRMALTVPSLVSWSAGRAARFAEDAGFEAEVIGTGGIVRFQSPPAGALAEPRRARIVLYTDPGAERPSVAVPDVRGLTAVSAAETLSGRRLNIRVRGADSYLSGTDVLATDQDPPAGSRAEPGAVVTVTFRSRSSDDDLEDAFPAPAG